MKIAAVIQDTWRVYEVLNERGDGVLGALRPEELDRCFAFLKRVAEHGPAELPENRSHHVSTDEPKIWQFDVTGTLRLLWFYDEGRIVILSHCFYKAGGKKNTTPRKLVMTAQAAHRLYFDAKAGGDLQVEIEDDDHEGK